MAERLQIWVLFGSLATGFSFIATQGGDMPYLVLLFPVLLAYLSMHVRNSEDTLKQIRKYLYRQEQDACYQGYEHFSRDPTNTRSSHGGYKKALRGAFCTTGALAVGGVVLRMVIFHLGDVFGVLAGSLIVQRLIIVHLPLLLTILAVIIAELVIIAFTWRQLSNPKKKQWAGVSRAQEEQVANG
jgi:hypothetical protein